MIEKLSDKELTITFDDDDAWRNSWSPLISNFLSEIDLDTSILLAVATLITQLHDSIRSTAI